MVGSVGAKLRLRRRALELERTSPLSSRAFHEASRAHRMYGTHLTHHCTERMEVTNGQLTNLPPFLHA
eukprot:scaffold2732_cov124-Pinguiococcus_pyrenoidosus.AAC.1